MSMKLGMIHYWFSEDDFKYVADKGLHYVEYCVNHDHSAEKFVEQIPQIKKWAEQYDIKIGAMGRWGEEIQNENGTLNEEKFKNHLTLIDAAAQLGCPVYNCGVNYITKRSFVQNCAFAVMALNKLVAYGKEKGVKVAVYNCGWNNFVCEPKAWEVIIPGVPGLGIKYDISHAMSRHSNYMAEIRDWGQYFYHVHLKGCLYIDGECFDTPLVGFDEINWGAVFTMLYARGYNGMLSIESESFVWSGERGEWGLQHTIKYINQFIMPESYGK